MVMARFDPKSFEQASPANQRKADRSTTETLQLFQITGGKILLETER